MQNTAIVTDQPALAGMPQPSGDPTYAGRLQQAGGAYDLLFYGALDGNGNPSFAFELGVELAKRLERRVRLLFAGRGPQEADLRRAAALYPGLLEVDFADPGASSLPPVRLLLLPGAGVPWRAMLEQACLAGLPVLASPQAGHTYVRLREGANSHVCELRRDLWAERAAALLGGGAACAARTVDDGALAARSGAVAGAAAGVTARGRRGNYVSWPTVLVVERQLLQYRVGFYMRLRDVLACQGIALQLLVGEGTAQEKMKQDEAELDWMQQIPTRYLLQGRLCWQPFGRYARDADLVIVMHENKLIYNLWLLFCARPRRIAFWGHGANMQSERPDGWKERFKRWTATKADWWFAYTELSGRMIVDLGFPADRMTVVENATDTREMVAQCAQVSQDALARRRELGEGPVGLYLGSLYREKRLDFLLAAARAIRERLPGFQLLVVGAGPDQHVIAEAAACLPWVHYLGPLNGREKCMALMQADVLLNPGLVGLGILDSFASGRPMFTTDCGLHSPEIAYLRHGENGIMTANDVTAYVDAVVRVLTSPEELRRLGAGAAASALRYTVENMAERLGGGVMAALATH